MHIVVKALSWALRELASRDPNAVAMFVADHEAALAARVKREVRSKLETGVKHAPSRKSVPRRAPKRS
jgi:3-methyladenine DNA glycosylase AlkD